MTLNGFSSGLCEMLKVITCEVHGGERLRNMIGWSVGLSESIKTKQIGQTS